jgi:hypothetical protein
MCVSTNKTKQCEYCGNEMKIIQREDVYANNWNKFCSKSCAAKMKFRNKSALLVEEYWPIVLNKFANQIIFPKLKPKSVKEKFAIYCERHKDSETNISNLLNKDRKSVFACPKCAKNALSEVDKEKKCSGCKRLLPLHRYRNCGIYNDGRKKKEAQCAECRSKKQKDYLDNRCDKERRKKVLAEWNDRKRESLGIVKGQKLCKVLFIKCKCCDNVFIIKGREYHRLTCSNDCYLKLRSIIHSNIKPKPRDVKYHKCKSCSKLVLAKTSNINCDDCVKDTKKGYKALRNKRIRNKYYELVKPNNVFNRDKWHCCMCNCKVQKKDIYAANAAEIDHIVPLSLGGVHTYTNVQTLCRKCNQSKSNQLLGQLTLAL